MFGKREVKQEKSKTVAVSQLSRQLEESIGKPNNPFLEYSKFDGEVSWEKSFWFLASLCNLFDAKIVWNCYFTNHPNRVYTVRGGSRIFFRRGCTCLLLYFNTNNHIVFFGRIPVVLENRRSSRGGGGNPLHPPLRSAPDCSAENLDMLSTEIRKDLLQNTADN